MARHLCLYFAGCLFLVCLVIPPFVFAQNPTTIKVIAHRGGRAEFDENTLSAFKGSYQKGARAFETDIRITKDGELVIFHDANLQRLGVQKSIEEMTFDEVSRLRTQKGNPIPTLKELVAFFNSKPGVSVEFELKTLNPKYNQELMERYVDSVCAIVFADMPASSDYFLTSFDKNALRYAKQKNPSMPMLLIFNEGLSQKVMDVAKDLGIDRIGCRIESTTRSMVEEAHRQGFKVSLGPTATINDFLLGVSLGCDYVCPDIPIEIINWAKKNAPWIRIQ